MRIAIFSDVHANLEALGTVVDAYRELSPDIYVCLGDVVGYGANPNECCEIVQSLAKVTILGNHDAAVAGRMDYSFYYDAARRALDLHRSYLAPKNLTWLRSLPYEHRDNWISFCHGSPVNHEEFDYIFALEQAQALQPVWRDLADCTFIGHSHLCKVFALDGARAYELEPDRFTLRPGFKYIISVGSVGQPRDYDPRSAYTLFDTETRTFEFHRIAYDIDGAARKIYAADLEPNFANRLYLGV